MLEFHKIVNILLKKPWKVLFKEDIFEIIDPEMKKSYQSKVDKTIYNLKSKWYIYSLKSWVYIVPDEEDKTINKVDIIDKYYLSLVKKYIWSFVWNNYFISWKKSLELHLKNYSVPDRIVVINKDLNKKIVVWDYLIIFKTISWKDEQSKNRKKINLFSKFSEFTTVKNIEGIDFKISSLELAIVESAILSDNDEWIPIELLSKAIKKYKGILNPEVFYEIGKYKYIMSFNRLKEISKTLDDQLYMIFLDVIKKNGWLFIWEWLRWF